MLNKSPKLKLYYSITEVARMIGVTEATLRYWEREFPTVNPRKQARGVRRYTEDDIAAIKLVYHYVKDCGMTTEGAKAAVKRNGVKDNHKVVVLEQLKDVRDELQAIWQQMRALQ